MVIKLVQFFLRKEIEVIKVVWLFKVKTCYKLTIAVTDERLYFDLI